MSVKDIIQAADNNKPKTISQLVDHELKVRAFNKFETRKTELGKEIIPQTKADNK